MSLLFTPKKIGSIEIKNRFVQSATFTASAKSNGEVSELNIKRHARLAKGGVGLIVKGAVFVHPWGRMGFGQVGIHSNDMIPGLKKLTEAVHNEGGKIVFQLHHAGDMTSRKLIGTHPIAPSSFGKDPFYGIKPREMTEEQIREVIDCFGQAAVRAAEAGADGVQIHGAHGYLVSKFLSPFFNRRTDGWGGSAENRFKFLKEIILTIRKQTPDLPILLKMNSHDHTPQEGTTHELTVQYGKWLSDLKLDALELSSGSTYSLMHLCMGDVPVDMLALAAPLWKRPIVKYVFNNFVIGKFPLTTEWHLPVTKKVRPLLGDMPQFLVGGVRTVERMNEILDNNEADFISLCRPLVREPNLVKKIKEGKSTSATCDSCNKCLISTSVLNIPIRCFHSYQKEKISEMKKKSHKYHQALRPGMM